MTPAEPPTLASRFRGKTDRDRDPLRARLARLDAGEHNGTAGQAADSGPMLQPLEGETSDRRSHLAAGVAALITATVLGLLSGQWGYSGLGGAGVACALIGLQRMRRAQRRSQIETQLPEALALCVSALRSGAGLTQALAAATHDAPSPLRDELQRVLRDVEGGLDLSRALTRFAARTASYEARLLATAVTLSAEVGGSPSTVLVNLELTLRDRARLRAEVRTLTAEAQLSGYLLLAMPVVVLGVLTVVNPNYVLPLFTHPSGPPLLAGGVILQLIGGGVMMRMSKLEA